jgi:prepilin-type N-terminal cleavage/methylation domain-containing protein/prepilin-type processing-associated H-X9-DG protein
MRTRNAFPTDGGFTLIELLCVIAIIAILMGLAMPAYSNFRDKSDGVKCSSNMRQIGAAVQAYVGANDGQFPEIETDPSNPVYPPDSQAKGLLQALAPYGLTEDVVKCPADVRIPAFNYFVKRGTSYEWAPYVDDELETAPQVFTRRGQLTMPASKIIVCFDTERVHGLKGDYKSKKNYLYADGHVRNYWETAPRPKPAN